MRNKIAKERILRKLIDCIILTSDNGLGIFFRWVSRPAIIDGKKTIGQLSDRACGGEGPVSKQGFRRIFVLHLVRTACGTAPAVSRTQLIAPPFYEHGSRAVDHRNGFTELVDMI